MEESLSIIEDAISDVGYWNWWAESLPKRFQLEFDGTQLLCSKLEEDKPPSTRIALSFLNPISINFLTRKDCELPYNWPELLHKDEIDPPTISYDRFTFRDKNMVKTIIEESISHHNFFGENLKYSELDLAKSYLAF